MCLLLVVRMQEREEEGQCATLGLDSKHIRDGARWLNGKRNNNNYNYNYNNSNACINNNKFVTLSGAGRGMID